MVTSGGADGRYEVSVAPCPKPLSPLGIEGATIICGKVKVPKDHDKPKSRKLGLTFAVYKSHSRFLRRMPSCTCMGGPGRGIIEGVALTTIFFDKLRQRSDIVAFDQRGVDTSGMDSRCFSTLAENVEDMVRQLANKKVKPDQSSGADQDLGSSGLVCN